TTKSPSARMLVARFEYRVAKLENSGASRSRRTASSPRYSPDQLLVPVIVQTKSGCISAPKGLVSPRARASMASAIRRLLSREIMPAAPSICASKSVYRLEFTLGQDIFHQRYA